MIKNSDSNPFLPKLRQLSKCASTRTISLKHSTLEVTNSISCSPKLCLVPSTCYKKQSKEMINVPKKSKFLQRTEFNSSQPSKLGSSNELSKNIRPRNEIKVIGKKLVGRAVNLKKFFSNRSEKKLKIRHDTKDGLKIDGKRKNQENFVGRGRKEGNNFLDSERFFMTGSSAFSINPWKIKDD